MASRTSRSKAPAESDVQVTPEEGKIENISTETTTEEKSTEPVNLEVETPSEEPTPAPAAPAAEKIQADIRDKLSNRSLEENVFIPSNPASIEKAAEEIARENGFEYNRGMSIGARLMARARRQNP